MNIPTKYWFKICQYDDKFNLHDEWDEWITAKDEFDAKHIIEKAYPEELNYKCILLNVV